MAKSLAISLISSIGMGWFKDFPLGCPKRIEFTFLTKNISGCRRNGFESSGHYLPFVFMFVAMAISRLLMSL